MGNPTAAPQGHLTHRQILLVFSGLMLGMFLAALDQTIVSAALPTIAADLGGFDKITWVVTSYLLTSTVTILLWGKLSDIYGRKVMFQASIGTFLVASVLIGLAPDMLWLILGRGLQGVGAGGIMSLAFAIIGDILSPRERGKYMGLMGSVFLLSSVLGPLLGGLIVDHLDWRWIFYVNLPIGIPALIVTGIVLRLPFARQPQRIDVLGALLVTLGSSMLILGLVWGGDKAPWGSYLLRWLPGVGDPTGASPGLDAFLADWLVTLLLAGGLLVLALFVLAETRTRQPLMPMSLFRDRTFTISSAVSFVVGAAMFGGFVFLPTYLQISTGVSATMSGFLLLPMVLGLMPMSTASGIIISKTGRYKWWPLAGLPVAILGMLLLSWIEPDSSMLHVGAGMFLLGAGIGMVMQVMVLAVQNALDVRQMGVGTAANNFMRSMGSVIGVSFFGVLFNSHVRDALKGLAQQGADPATVAGILQSDPARLRDLPAAIRDPVAQAVADGVGAVFLSAIPLALAAWVLVAFLKEVPLRSTRNVGAVAAMEGAEAAAVEAAKETVPVTPPLAASRAPAVRPSPPPAPAKPAGGLAYEEVRRRVDALPPPRRRS